MPKLIKASHVVEDSWQPVDADTACPGRQQILSLDQWLRLTDKSGRAVMLEPGQAPAPLFDHLEQIPLIAINFPVFTDGRGFSYGRELREHGFAGELRACGHFIRDQMSYLHAAVSTLSRWRTNPCWRRRWRACRISASTTRQPSTSHCRCFAGGNKPFRTVPVADSVGYTRQTPSRERPEWMPAVSLFPFS